MTLLMLMNGNMPTANFMLYDKMRQYPTVKVSCYVIKPTCIAGSILCGKIRCVKLPARMYEARHLIIPLVRLQKSNIQDTNLGVLKEAGYFHIHTFQTKAYCS